MYNPSLLLLFHIPFCFPIFVFIHWFSESRFLWFHLMWFSFVVTSTLVHSLLYTYFQKTVRRLGDNTISNMRKTIINLVGFVCGALVLFLFLWFLWWWSLRTINTVMTTTTTTTATTTNTGWRSNRGGCSRTQNYDLATQRLHAMTNKIITRLAIVVIIVLVELLCQS